MKPFNDLINEIHRAHQQGLCTIGTLMYEDTPRFVAIYDFTIYMAPEARIMNLVRYIDKTFLNVNRCTQRPLGNRSYCIRVFVDQAALKKS